MSAASVTLCRSVESVGMMISCSGVSTTVQLGECVYKHVQLNKQHPSSAVSVSLSRLSRAATDG